MTELKRVVEPEDEFCDNCYFNTHEGCGRVNCADEVDGEFVYYIFVEESAYDSAK